jgi:hypothetical protein
VAPRVVESPCYPSGIFSPWKGQLNPDLAKSRNATWSNENEALKRETIMRMLEIKNKLNCFLDFANVKRHFCFIITAQMYHLSHHLVT